MMSKLQKTCRYCNVALDRDAVGLNQKLFENESKKGHLICLSCMAEYLDCQEDELREKIKEFKSEGCKLFS